jgi:hypothetical protein
MNDATMQLVRMINGKTVRTYTITRGMPVATVWQRVVDAAERAVR